MADKTVTISIPVPLQERIEKLILEEGSSKSVSDYVASALGEALAEREARAPPQALNEEETSEIKKRLIALGYI